MKKSLHILLILGFTALGLQAQVLRQQFNKQVEQSCAGPWAYGKQVAVDAQPAERKVFDLDCAAKKAVDRTKSETISFNFASELVYTLEYAADDPFLKDHFNVQSQDGETIYQRKVDHTDNTPLEMQRVRLDPKGTIREIETHIFKDNWLYSLRIITVVKFDENGKYQSHDLRTENDVILSGKSVTDIKGWVEK